LCTYSSVQVAPARQSESPQSVLPASRPRSCRHHATAKPLRPPQLAPWLDSDQFCWAEPSPPYHDDAARLDLCTVSSGRACPSGWRGVHPSVRDVRPPQSGDSTRQVQTPLAAAADRSGSMDYTSGRASRHRHTSTRAVRSKAGRDGSRRPSRCHRNANMSCPENTPACRDVSFMLDCHRVLFLS
jgi:hypothetical protein